MSEKKERKHGLVGACDELEDFERLESAPEQLEFDTELLETEDLLLQALDATRVSFDPSMAASLTAAVMAEIAPEPSPSLKAEAKDGAQKPSWLSRLWQAIVDRPLWAPIPVLAMALLAVGFWWLSVETEESSIAEGQYDEMLSARDVYGGVEDYDIDGVELAVLEDAIDPENWEAEEGELVAVGLADLDEEELAFAESDLRSQLGL